VNKQKHQECVEFAVSIETGNSFKIVDAWYHDDGPGIMGITFTFEYEGTKEEATIQMAEKAFMSPLAAIHSFVNLIKVFRMGCEGKAK